MVLSRAFYSRQDWVLDVVVPGCEVSCGSGQGPYSLYVLLSGFHSAFRVMERSLFQIFKHSFSRVEPRSNIAQKLAENVGVR